MPYSPLGRWYLTGSVRADRVFASHDPRRNHLRSTREAIATNQGMVDLFGRFGERHGATPAQLRRLCCWPGNAFIASIGYNANERGEAGKREVAKD